MRPASFRNLRNLYSCMGDQARRREFAIVDVVRCLGCGAQYPKPNGGGTARANPGCPACGYLGWVGVTPDAESLHSAADQRRRRSA